MLLNQISYSVLAISASYPAIRLWSSIKGIYYNTRIFSYLYALSCVLLCSLKFRSTNLHIRHDQQIGNLCSVIEEAVPVKHVNGSGAADDRRHD